MVLFQLVTKISGIIYLFCQLILYFAKYSVLSVFIERLWYKCGQSIRLPALFF